MFKIANGNIYDFNVTVFTIGRADGADWTFVPFEVGETHLFAASDRLALAIGAVGQMRVFDIVDERRVLDIPASARDTTAYLKPWAFAPARAAFFFASYNNVREVSLDGKIDRVHEISSPHAPLTIVEIDADTEKPRIFLASGYGKIATAILDPETGDTVSSAIDGMCGSVSYKEATKLQWPSPDGRFVLRHHLGSVVRLAPAKRRLWLVGDGDPLSKHPDFAADGEVRYGLAIDVYRTNPFAFQQRIITRLVTADDITANRAKSGWNREACALGMQVIDALAAAVDYRNWDQRSQLLHTQDRDTPGDEAAYDRDLCMTFFVRMIQSINWEPSGDAIEVVFADGLRRCVSLAGDIRPLAEHVPAPYLSVHANKLAPIRAKLRNKAIHRIELPDLTAQSCADAIAAMTAKLDAGLDKLVFRDTLGFNFVLPQGSLTESAFFGHVRAASEADRTILAPALRALMASFGKQIDAFKPSTHEQLQGTELHLETDSPQAAMVEPAVALASLDPTAFEVLKPWFAAIDGEHDIDCIPRAFAAIAETSRFNGAAAIRFGVWFAATTQQSWSRTPEIDQLTLAARRQMAPAEFAVMACDIILEKCARGDVGGRNVHLPPLPPGDVIPPEVAAFPARMPDPPSARSYAILELLDAKVGWDREARTALEPLLAIAEAEHQRLKAAIDAEARRRRAITAAR